MKIDGTPIQSQFPDSAGIAGKPTSTGSAGSVFAEALERAGAMALETQQGADQAVKDFAAGKDAGLHETMLSLERAEISMKFLMSVRNRVIDAYHEIMRMGG